MTAVSRLLIFSGGISAAEVAAVVAGGVAGDALEGDVEVADGAEA